MEVDGEDSDAVLERQLSASVRMTLFDEQPAYLNAFFRLLAWFDLMRNRDCHHAWRSEGDFDFADQ